MDRGTNKQHLFHRKHDGKVLEALPMLFTFTPLQQQHQAHGVVGSFSQAGMRSNPHFSRCTGSLHTHNNLCTLQHH